MGCCAALLATRSSVKVQPASVQQTSHAAGGCRQLSLIHAEPPPASSPSYEPHHLPFPTTAASIWSAVESNLKEADDSHCRKKTKTANWDTLYVYIASVYEDFAEVNHREPLVDCNRPNSCSYPSVSSECLHLSIV